MEKKDINNVCNYIFVLSYKLVYLFIDRNNGNKDDDDDRYATPNIHGSRGKIIKTKKNEMIMFLLLDSPSRTEWDDDGDSDKRRSQWEHPTPTDNYNRQGYRKQRDTDYYNRYE
jgi:hypothetical protein